MGATTRKLRESLLGRARVVMICAALVAVGIVALSSLVDEGEIVRVTTLDAKGRTHVTPLWIVDLDGRVYLRARSPDAGWLERVRAEPEVTLQRRDADARFRALSEESAAIRAEVNLAMSEKYGFADRLWTRVSDPARAVPVLLAPSTESAMALP